MQLVFTCPHCRQPVRCDVDRAGGDVPCPTCGWSRAVGSDELLDNGPTCCLACGCGDLWRQKDFPARLGLLIVGLGTILSTLAWFDYRPELAIGILLMFALADLLLYWLMADVLVCYRCGAKHRRPPDGDQHASFDLEVAERYRQEAMRLRETVGTPPGRPDAR